MTPLINSWGPVVIIVIGYIVGLYFQNKRLDDFKEGLYKYLGAEFGATKDRLDKIEKKLEKIEEVRLIR